MDKVLWHVQVYNKRNKVIKQWMIVDRTEHEASREAEADVARIPNADDWTMTEITGPVAETYGIWKDMPKKVVDKFLEANRR